MEIPGIIFGFFLGFISGIIPGLHSNTIASILLKLDLAHFAAAAAIASMSASRAVFEFIPAIFLFIPDSDTVVSVLPGHRLLMEGRGRYALVVCAYAAIAAVAISLLLVPLAYLAMPVLYSSLEPNMLPILILACAFLLASERKAKAILLALGAFLLSGTLGLFALQVPGLRDPLLPVFCGLFAVPGILLSFREESGIPKQKDEKIDVPRSYLPYVLCGVVLGMLSDLFPGISTPAQIAVFASIFLLLNAPKFLALVSSIAVSHTLFAFVAAGTIGKARTGSSVAIRELIGSPTLEQTVWLLGISVFSMALAAITVVLISKRLASLLSGAPVREIGVVVLAYLVVLVFAFNGPMGLLFLSTGACIGAIPPLVGVRRTHLMGAILVPSLVSLAGLSGAFLSLALG